MSRLKDLFKKSTNESAKTEEINEAQFGPSVPLQIREVLKSGVRILRQRTF